RRQPLDDAQPLDVGLAVQARAAGRALRAHEPLVLVEAQRLRVHADELGRDADHVDRTVAHDDLLPRVRARWVTMIATATATPIQPPTRHAVRTPFQAKSQMRALPRMPAFASPMPPAAMPPPAVFRPSFLLRSSAVSGSGASRGPCRSRSSLRL